MTLIFVDTNILIDYSKGHSRFLETLFTRQDTGDAELFINPIVISEFMADRSLHDEKKRKLAWEFLLSFSIKDITKSTGLLAGEFLCEGYVDSIGDAMIAATCVTHSLRLITRNTKHFKKIRSLDLY
ncbi:PIN domain-containing protein [Candidatus Gottesmanbacteria bacterium]|nr:PIN domain-containing protein [Candidatus Gottesmanbacteria bacterium]